MDLRQIEYFLAVAGGESLSTVAQSMSVTKPSLSQGIRSLERELGVDLFHRVGRGLVLTSAGRALIGPARAMLRSSAAASNAAIGVDAEPKGRLDICSAAPGLEGPVARIVADFRRRCPGITVRVSDLPRGATAEHALADGACELVFSYWPPELSSLSTQVIGVNEYWLAVPSQAASDLWPGGVKPASEQPVPLSALPNLPVVGVQKHSRARLVIESALHDAGARTRMSTELAQRETVGAFVLEGLGMALLERSLAERMAASGTDIFPVEPPISLTYGIEFDPQRLSPLGRLFVQGLPG
ncbi:LysR family transcriptional regulator [Rhodococcus sp. OK302]|uniref:LysR family transcriptional regulator n=1 Tax=Rhodococcus sp. OK302 TaxID=1882769 RepID=UPI000B942471|nr:LysR family transcriptional regulator [Rhodococcus sp. OK302]